MSTPVLIARRAADEQLVQVIYCHYSAAPEQFLALLNNCWSRTEDQDQLFKHSSIRLLPDTAEQLESVSLALQENSLLDYFPLDLYQQPGWMDSYLWSAGQWQLFKTSRTR